MMLALAVGLVARLSTDVVSGRTWLDMRLL